jgi:REP element-mobilizing transposase RayT
VSAENSLPKRRTLHHIAPPWVKDGSLYFVTICTELRGQNQLCRPDPGLKLLESAVRYHNEQQWWLKIFLLMPDHVHAMIAVLGMGSLSAVIQVWKAYQTTHLAVRWQSGFFDHRLRSDESEDAKTDYIRLNPVRAGLIDRAEDWPYFWPKPEDGD